MAENKKKLTADVECLRVEEQKTAANSVALSAEKGPLCSKIEKSRTRSKSYVMDLRIHSPASLEYHGIEGLDPAPALVRLARVKGLDVIAVTDFYSGEFVDRVVSAAQGSEVTVLPGVVIRCCVEPCSDVTLLCLFPENTTTGKIAEFLKTLDVPRQASGNQSYVVRMPLKDILTHLVSYGGIAIPSRMDKTPQRVAVIPRLVEEFGFRAFDLAYADSSRLFKKRWPKIKFQLFSFSSANALAQVGSRTAKAKLTTPDFEGIREWVQK